MFCKRLLVVIAIPALAAGMAFTRASAQTPQQQSTLDARPFGTSRTDPDGGEWFFANAVPGQAQSFKVRLFNPTTQPKTVHLFLADMAFNADGTPYVTTTATDVGGWGHFDRSQVTVAPRHIDYESFSVTPKKGADPGDHIGAAVFEEAPTGTGPVKTIQRVALRIYLTLPGDARKEFEINKVEAARHTVFYPRRLSVTVELKNTGRVRLVPTVAVNNAVPYKAGSTQLMSKSVERYHFTFPVRFWGGPMRLHVNATTKTSFGKTGPARDLSVTVWVIPWHLLSLLALLALISLGVRYLLKRRARRVKGLQADIRRLERLLVQQTREPEGVDAPARRDVEVAIRSAIKQAKRAGDDKTAERLERKLSDNAMTKCPSCGRALPVVAKHCGYCGTSLTAAS